ncbi:hypothetical protein PsAD2_01489 [Pseudovibrio axinellae]|uniref:Uncharacterized protein n=1 Tax=Pseudovibrio axinellae TaxID=989403 RepID=A0A165ZR86_9HYPH|nr:hypothetical protein PsAD2_01489 [Pseudovibrio axinellae]SEQ60453.1 hypothetical protein SAMN05421798_103210 [Pseudovibrio axinellae]
MKTAAKRRGLSAKALTTFSPTTRQNLTTIFSCHTCPEAVATLANKVARLESTLHFITLAEPQAPTSTLIWIVRHIPEISATFFKLQDFAHGIRTPIRGRLY